MVDVIAQDAVDHLGHMLMLGEQDVATDVVAESVLPESPAQSAWRIVLLQHLARVPEESLQRQAADAATEDPDVHSTSYL